MRPFQPPVYGPFRVWTRAPCTPYTSLFSHLGLPLDSQPDSVLFMCIKEIHSERSLYMGQCPFFSTPPIFWSRCLFNTSIEIQDPDRDPPRRKHMVFWVGRCWLTSWKTRTTSGWRGRSIRKRVCAFWRSSASPSDKHGCASRKKHPTTRLLFTSPVSFVQPALPVNHVIRCGLWRVLLVFYCVVFVLCHCTDICDPGAQNKC